MNDSLTHLDVSNNQLIRAESSKADPSIDTQRVDERDQDAVAYAGQEEPFSHNSKAGSLPGSSSPTFSSAVAKWSGIEVAQGENKESSTDTANVTQVLHSCCHMITVFIA
jgi:hypothetical protein